MSGTSLLCLDLGVAPRAESEELLRQATVAWREVQTHYRDGRLRVGGVLQAYLEACAAEAHDASDKHFEARRAAALEEAGERLGAGARECWELVRAAAAVRVLGGGDAGRLAYSAVVHLAVYVERRPGSEEWGVKEGGAEGPQLFRRAAREGWARDRVRDLSRRAEVRRRGKAAGMRELVPTPTPFLVATARAADPRDLAEMVWTLIESSPRKGEVLELVRARLGGVAPGEVRGG